MSLTPFDDLLFRPFYSYDFLPVHSYRWPHVVHRRQRSEAEDEFEQFVRSVDGRFGGMLAHLHPTPQEAQAAQEQDTEEQGESSKPDRYRMKVAVQNFKPSDIKVKVQGNNVIVEAKREEKKEQEGMYAHSYCEFKRSFPIPDGVDKKQLQSHLSSGGVLEIDAPMLEPVEAPKPQEKQKIDVEHMEEE